VLELLQENAALRARPPPSSSAQPPLKRKRRASATPSSDDVRDVTAGPSRLPSASRSNSNTSSASRAPSPRKREAEEAPPSSDVEELAPSARVPCPVCAARVQISHMDAHIERGCAPAPAARPPQKAQWAGIMGTRKARAEPSEPLPKVSYSTLKDKAIKALLAEQGLPGTGTKAAWIARHKRSVPALLRPRVADAQARRFVMTWNANLDRAPGTRKSADELRAELRRWEDAQARAAAKGTADVPEPGAHARAHASEFARLVAQARHTPGSSETEVT
jgi:E3 ubiquitin-protein ligase RAD18